jgi:hypothetical protein
MSREENEFQRLPENFGRRAGKQQLRVATRFVSRIGRRIDRPRLKSTYLGGDGSDRAFALAIHGGTGEVYVAGVTSSTDFPKVSWRRADQRGRRRRCIHQPLFV